MIKNAICLLIVVLLLCSPVLAGTDELKDALEGQAGELMEEYQEGEELNWFEKMGKRRLGP